MRSKRTQLLLAVLLIAAVVAYFTWRGKPTVASATQAASAIRAVVKKDVQFLDVTVNARPDATIFIVAPARLSRDARTTLEQVVREKAPGQRINISYVVQSEGSGR